MKKTDKRVRLTEAQLHRVIKESVQQVLRENPEEEGFWGRAKGAAQGVYDAARGEYGKAKRGITNTGLNNEYQGQTMASRFNAAKSMVRNSAQQGDDAQEINNTISAVEKIMQNPSCQTQNIQQSAQALINALNSANDSRRMGRINAQYSRNYGQKYNA